MAAHQAEYELQQHAKRLLNDDGLKRVLKVIKEQAFAEWCHSSEAAVDYREQRHALFRGIGRLESQIKALADGARLDERKAEAAKRK